MSFYFKLMAPIWGVYVQNMPNLDTAYKELSAYDLLSHSRVHELPAMDRFKEYCEALAEKDKKSLAPAICVYMGTNEIPRYFVAMAIVRRLAICVIRDPEETVIITVYKFLNSKAKNLSNGVRDKRAGKLDNGEEESVTDRYRISNAIDDASIVVQETWTEDIAAVVRALDENGDVDKAMRYNSLLQNNPLFAIGEYHLPIVATVCKRVIFPRSCRIYNRETYLRLIAVTAAWLEANGYEGLAMLMLSTRRPKEEDEVNINEVGGFRFQNMPREYMDKLDAMYPYREQSSPGKPSPNPGLTTINSIVYEINSYDWPDNDKVPMDLYAQLAKLFIDIEERL